MKKIKIFSHRESDKVEEQVNEFLALIEKPASNANTSLPWAEVQDIQFSNFEGYWCVMVSYKKNYN